MKHCLFVLLFFFGLNAFAQQRTGYVQLNRVVWAHPEYSLKAMNTYLGDSNSLSALTYDSLMVANQLHNDLRLKLDRERHELMSDEIKRREKQIAEVAADIAAYNKRLKEERLRALKRDFATCLDDAYSAIAAVGKKQKYDRIVEGMRLPNRNYPPQDDLTDEVIRYMRKHYKR